MTNLVNSTERLREDMLIGFADAHADLILPVPEVVVRATRPPASKIAAVVDGSFDHYPRPAASLTRASPTTP